MVSVRMDKLRGDFDTASFQPVAAYGKQIRFLLPPEKPIQLTFRPTKVGLFNESRKF